jgi:hypothetical protein
VSADASTTVFRSHVLLFRCAQILRWNWSRVVLALSFARSTASMAFALRFSILPLIDNVMQLAFDGGVDDPFEDLSPAHECEIERSSINLQRFTVTKYAEAELRRFKPRARKVPDS